WVVTPVRLAPTGRRWRPFPPAAARAVIDGVRVVQGSPGAQPWQQPVVGFLNRAAPAAAVERLDPDARPIIEMSQRTVNLRVTVVIAARYREPTMGPQIVRIEMHRGHGMSGARRPLLIEATQQVVTFVPVKERLEERRFRQFSAHTMIV